MWIFRLLTKPNEFFCKFNEHKKNWLIALSSYCFYSLGNTVALLVAQKSEWNFITYEEWKVIAEFLLEETLLVFLFINTLWVSFTKLFRGTARIKDNIVAIGYSFFWPSLSYLFLALFQIPLYFVYGDSFFESEGYNMLFWLMMLIRVWALFNAGIAINHLNYFKKDKTFLVGLCVAIALVSWMEYTLNPN